MTRADPSDFDLVEQAQAGDPQKRDAIACMVQERVYPYLRRVTLSEHKAEDLTQDTVLAVLKSLGTFRRPDKFWPWVFAIASNLLRQQARSQARHRTISMSSVDETQLASWQDEEDGSTRTSRRELAELTSQAMERVNERYRMVLNLRFYEDLPHAEVARVMGCTEFNARALFCRAKHGLARELKKMGVGRKALVPALAAFGTMTLYPNAAPAVTVSISSGAAAEGLLTTMLTAKVKVVLALFLLLSAAGAWSFMNGRGRGGTNQAAGGQPAATLNAQGVSPSGLAPGAADRSPLRIHTVCRGRALGAKAGIPQMFDLWYYLPEGPNGPRMKRHVPVDDGDRGRVNWDIETPEANYHYRASQEEMHITNDRAFCGEGHTATLPTDSPEFCAFIQAMDGEMSHAMVNKEGFTFSRDPRTGFVVGALDTRPGYSPPCESVVEYNPPMQVDPFAYVPPANMKVVDDRDIMHRRGWTWLRVSGQLAGQPVKGVGQVPFTYAASLKKPQWVRLRIGDRFVLTDDGRQAVVQDASGSVRVAVAGGGFLKGMSRPWAGFHTVDTIRRDAADIRCNYTTAPDEEPLISVRLFKDGERSPASHTRGAEFIVDSEADLLQSARYWRQAETETVSELKFTYLENLDGLDAEFAMPEVPAADPSVFLPIGTPLWPLELPALLGIN